MKYCTVLYAVFFAFFCLCCQPMDADRPQTNFSELKFTYKSTLNIGGKNASEISAYDAKSKKLFIVNNDNNASLKEVSVYDISDINNPVKKASLDFSGFGSPNSVAVCNGKLAVAVEAAIKQEQGKVYLYDATTSTLINEFTVGALPDMVAFSSDGKFIVTANEGEPNEDYTIDPEGSISIIDVVEGTQANVGFSAFNSQKEVLEQEGFRVFGPNATLTTDVEPEYIAITDDSKIAYVTLQENNGVARVNLIDKTIEAIKPLGFKNYNEEGNEIDASDKDDDKALKSWPVYGLYQPDGIAITRIRGYNIIVTANEGDARGYDGAPGFKEEARVSQVVLDELAFPIEGDFQNEAKLGRLKMTTTLGDTDDDGDYDEIYAFGGRSFSIWAENGQLLYDSGNEIASRTLNLTPDAFNSNDTRSDDKGAEPESVTITNINGKHILFVGLERNNQVLQYDISNPTAPQFIDILSRDGDFGPKGLLVISKNDSPTGNTILVVSNEVSGTVSFYENAGIKEESEE